MAKIEFDSMIKSLSGRVGNFVFYMNNGNAYARRYVVPRNPDTPDQHKRRTRFADAVHAWQKLTDTEKKLWNAKARRRLMSGYNLFISAFCIADSPLKVSYMLRSHSVSTRNLPGTSELEAGYSPSGKKNNRLKDPKPGISDSGCS